MRKYLPRLASKYWDKRVEETLPLCAVLNLGLPKYANSSFDKWQRTSIFEMLGDISNKSIIDIGCGVGRVCIPLAKMDSSVVGLDISQAMLNICSKQAKKEGVSKNLKLIKASVTKLPFKDQEFDIVVCSELLFHLPESEVKKSVAEICRVLKNGGKCVVSVNNSSNNLSTYYLKKDMKQQRKDGYFYNYLHDTYVRDLFTRYSCYELSRKGAPAFSFLINLKKIPKIGYLYVRAQEKFEWPFMLLHSLSSWVDGLNVARFLDKRFSITYLILFQKSKK